jgi:hypothetical protein
LFEKKLWIIKMEQREHFFRITTWDMLQAAKHTHGLAHAKNEKVDKHAHTNSIELSWLLS